jgi:hypothetical protein
MRALRILIVALWVVAIALRINNAVRYPLDGTADARLGHLAYVGYVKEHWRQPPTTLNWETWQPPLYYWIAAGLWTAGTPVSLRPTDIFAWPQRAILPLFSSLLGLATAWIALRVTRRLVPDDPLAQVLALALVLFWPLHLMLAPWVRSDLLSVLFASLVVGRLVAARDLTRRTTRDAVALGVLLGLGLLTKYTGAANVVVVGATLGIAALANPPRLGAAARTFGIVLGIAAGISGWFYLDHWLAHGKPFATPHDWLGGFRHPPGARGWWDYIWFAPAVFAHPWVNHPAVIHSVPAGTYATAWFDGQYIFLNHYMARPLAEAFGRVLLGLGILPTVAIAAGGIIALGRALRAGGSSPYVPLVVSAAWAMIAYVFLNLEAPYYSTVKAHYLFPAAVAATVFFALGVAAAPRWLRIALAADMLALVALASVVFWFGLVTGGGAG